MVEPWPKELPSVLHIVLNTCTSTPKNSVNKLSLICVEFSVEAKYGWSGSAGELVGIEGLHSFSVAGVAIGGPGHIVRIARRTSRIA
eukprot:16447793-Heterocapsa_arctica.AAC.1